jgi:hypothetical protein
MRHAWRSKHRVSVGEESHKCSLLLPEITYIVYYNREVKTIPILKKVDVSQ